MNNTWSEKTRIFLVNRILTAYSGMTLSELLRLFRTHRYAIDPPYLPRAAFMVGAATINSALHRYEDRHYSPRIKDVEIEQPLFILGHRRSGTSHLYNLLVLDQRFAYPNVFQALNPHTFLSTERFSRSVSFIAPRTRIIDNMGFGFEVPFEDEFSTIGSLHTPLLWWIFPQSEEYYNRYHSFRGVSEEEIARWKSSLLLFYKKLTWKYNRPLVLKSPPHTSRIKLLLEMFPEARFVHIHRNPYNVFQSTKRQTITMIQANRLQHMDKEQIDEIIIKHYKQMYDVFFEERELIPAGQYHEVCFEELEEDRVGQIRNIYEKLNLPCFEAVQQPLQRYVNSISTYRKNEYPELPVPLRKKIAHSWEKSFEIWGYPTNLSNGA